MGCLDNLKIPSSLLLVGFIVMLSTVKVDAFVLPHANTIATQSSTMLHAETAQRKTAVRPKWDRVKSLFKRSSKKKDNGTTAVVTTDAFQELLKTRRTINEFEPTLPSDWEDKLQKAISTAIYAPNHKRTEPWRFHLLGSESIQRVCELNAQIVSEKKGEEAGAKKLKRWLTMPGWLVVTCQKGPGDMDKDPMSLAREDYAAVCCAVQNLCLSLHADGMCTKWNRGGVNFYPEFAKEVGFYGMGTKWTTGGGNISISLLVFK